MRTLRHGFSCADCETGLAVRIMTANCADRDRFSSADCDRFSCADVRHGFSCADCDRFSCADCDRFSCADCETQV